MSKIKQPSHYTNGCADISRTAMLSLGIPSNELDDECIEVMKRNVTFEQFIGFCYCSAIKYLWRVNSKDDPITNIGKAEYIIRFAIAYCKEHFQSEDTDLRDFLVEILKVKTEIESALALP